MQWLRGRSIYPLSLIIIEILGNLAGPFALWRSRFRVKREGRSEPYIPVSQRPILIEDPLLVGSFDTPSAVETGALLAIMKEWVFPGRRRNRLDGNSSCG
jgi:hypothetical protein